MLRWIARRRLAAFENAFNYDASYLRDMLEVSLPAFLRFSQVAKLAQQRGDVPLDAWYAEKIATLLMDDCGPCTQLAVEMAESRLFPSVKVALGHGRACARIRVGTDQMRRPDLRRNTA